MEKNDISPRLANLDLARSWLGNKGAKIEKEYNQAMEAGAKKEELADIDRRRRSIDRDFERISRKGRIDHKRVLRFATYEIRRRAELMAQENNTQPLAEVQN